MKATPELLQQALRVLEIGLSPEIASKILATVRLLDEKGDSADLKDFALIEAFYSEKIEPESEPLPSGIIEITDIDLGIVRDGDIVVFRDESSELVLEALSNSHNYRLVFKAGFSDFFKDGKICGNLSSMYDIVKIIKPTKPQ